MGCLSSRSTIRPTTVTTGNQAVSEVQQNGDQTDRAVMNTREDTRFSRRNDNNNSFQNVALLNDNIYDDDVGGGGGGYDKTRASMRGIMNKTIGSKSHPSMNSSMEVPDTDIISILMDNKESYKESGKKLKDNVLNNENNVNNNFGTIESTEKPDSGVGNQSGTSNNNNNNNNGENSPLNQHNGDESGKKEKGNSLNESGNDESNMELLRQYVIVDYEINQLEDKDALRVYHEKIEQLEQLERELDMISGEAERVAVRSETDEHLNRLQSLSLNGIHQGEQKMDGENESLMMSGASGSLSHNSWLANADSSATIKYNGPTSNTNQQNNIIIDLDSINNSIKNSNSNNNNNINNNNNNNNNNNSSSIKTNSRLPDESNKGSEFNKRDEINKNSATLTNKSSRMKNQRRFHGKPSYSTIEEVFNRKIILEKERDKLKKEVETVIVECDKLQQRYKKRDDILDKLFDGKTGNGLENHLEQQLNWLLEQKHYVDQVFYAWKRAETLTSQTCEQFSSALDLLKSLPQIEDPEQKAELSKSIGGLLAKSRQDMEQAQKYNPNVDAPFFTDNETERFDKIIETISKDSMSPSEFSQISTVIQFAYKRAVSIRLWLEQILQATIARDSFELAEEYKWIAIQLRKERINLIKAKLQNPPYLSMVQETHEQLRAQQSLVERRQQHEINRDSGVESETNDIDIEEEIYRLLELNKSRLEGSYGALQQNETGAKQKVPFDKQFQQHQNKFNGNLNITMNDSAKDEMIRNRIHQRTEGELQLHLNQMSPPPQALAASSVGAQTKHTKLDQIISTRTEPTISSLTPSKLKIELDEEARQSLIKQVDQIHNRHRNRIETLRGNNRAKASSSIMNRMKQARKTQYTNQADTPLVNNKHKTTGSQEETTNKSGPGGVHNNGDAQGQIVSASAT